jgi:hypothetical protein
MSSFPFWGNRSVVLRRHRYAIEYCKFFASFLLFLLESFSLFTMSDACIYDLYAHQLLRGRGFDNSHVEVENFRILLCFLYR